MPASGLGRAAGAPSSPGQRAVPAADHGRPGALRRPPLRSGPPPEYEPRGARRPRNLLPRAHACKIASFRTGPGQAGFSQEGHKSPISVFSALTLPDFATFNTHFPMTKFIMGNRGTSATTPFVPTPSGSR